jgi:hypothetical protein
MKFGFLILVLGFLSQVTLGIPSQCRAQDVDLPDRRTDTIVVDSILGEWRFSAHFKSGAGKGTLLMWCDDTHIANKKILKHIIFGVNADAFGENGKETYYFDFVSYEKCVQVANILTHELALKKKGIGIDVDFTSGTVSRVGYAPAQSH